MTISTNPALSAWIRLLKVHNLVIRQSRAKISEYCTLAQFDILAQLSREPGGTTPLELSRRLLVTAGNITGIIDRMEESGLVQRRRDPADRRVIRIHLTPQGKRLAKSAIPKHARDIRQAFLGLSRQETEELRKLLDKVIERIETTRASANGRKK